jgi:signal transduction histidine kinase
MADSINSTVSISPRQTRQSFVRGRKWFIRAWSNPFSWILIRTVVVPIVATTLAVAVLEWQFERSASETQWIDHTELVVETTEDAQTNFMEAENYLRGYLLTKAEHYRDSFTKSFSAADNYLGNLGYQVSDNPAQGRKSARIAEMVSEWKKYADNAIELRQSGGDYLRWSENSKANALGDSIHSRFSDFLAIENDLRIARSETSHRSNRSLIVWALVVGPLAGIILGLIGIREIRTLSEKYNTALETARKLRAEAERGNQAKDEFMAMISHELRNPVNAITLSSRRLRTDPAFPPDLARALDAIDRGAKSIGAMAADLIDSTRIASGQLQLKLESVDLVSIVQSAIDVMRPSAEAKNLTLQSRLGVVSAPLEGDRERLHESVCNLVGNAIKFTPAGGTIEVALEKTVDGANLRVSDTGVGIDPAFLPRIFDRFAQGGSSAERRGGLGLGLAIVKHVIELHGGTVTASSDGIGRGARVVIFLPNRRSCQGRESL